jgi:6-phosphogluconolactonase (cycloisomerase 2 family)
MLERTRQIWRDVVGIALLGFALSACNGGAQAPLPARVAPLARVRAPDDAVVRLFVASSYNVGVYQASSGKYERKIGNGRFDGRALFVAANGDVLVSNYGKGVITVYGVPELKSLQKITGIKATLMTQDSSGNLYVRDQNGIQVFAPGSSTPYNPQPVRTVKSGIKEASSIAVDSLGNLYVANFRPGTDVVMYAPGAETPTQTITNGISYPYTLAIDASNNVYVGNRGPTPTVTVYAAGTLALTHTITDSVTGPSAMAFDNDTLYVANYGNECCSIVGVYAGKTLKLTRTIQTGLDIPDGLAVDKKHNVYVANFNNNTVTVYGPKSDVPALTITQNVSYPTAVSLEQ